MNAAQTQSEMRRKEKKQQTENSTAKMQNSLTMKTTRRKHKVKCAEKKAADRKQHGKNAKLTNNETNAAKTQKVKAQKKKATDENWHSKNIQTTSNKMDAMQFQASNCRQAESNK